MEASQFDASSDPNHQPPVSKPDQPVPSSESRPFLGIRFKCCRTYGRIYRNQEQTAYEGQCPKCRARIKVPIGSGGTGTRFFDAS